MRRLAAIAVLLSLASCRWHDLVPDSIHLGVGRGEVSGSTVLNTSGFGDLLGEGEPLEAESDYDAETYVFLLGWDLWPSRNDGSRALKRMEDRLVRMEALLRERAAEPPTGPR